MERVNGEMKKSKRALPFLVMWNLTTSLGSFSLKAAVKAPSPIPAGLIADRDSVDVVFMHPRQQQQLAACLR